MATNYISLAFPMGESLSESDIEEVYNTGMDTGGLDFSGADLSGDQPYFIADLLSSNKMISIVHIDLSHTKTTVEGFEAILFAAMEIKTLESFVAKALSLPKEAGMSLSKLIASKGCLKILDVSQNDLGDVGLSNLSGAFSADHSKIMTKQLLSVVALSVLDLSNNNLGDAGVLSLCRGLSQFVRRAMSVGVTPALKVLLLHNNHITDKAAICLAQLINFRDTTAVSTNGVISPIPKSGLNNSLHLDELGLNDNPLTARGITALLGYASEGVISPLKRLLLANTAVDVEVFELLGQNLLHNSTMTLSQIDLSVSAQQAAELVQGTANTGTTNGNSNTNAYHARRLYSALNQLCHAILQITTTNDNCFSMQLGFLHRTLFTQAVYLTRSMHESTEIVRTLELLNHPVVAKVVGHTVVPNVEQWLRSAEYVYSEHTLVYSNSEQAHNTQPLSFQPQLDTGRNEQTYVVGNTTTAHNNNNNESQPMFTPTKAHFAFTTDNTHLTEDAPMYEDNTVNTTPYASTKYFSYANNSNSNFAPVANHLPTTNTTTHYEESEEENFEIETVLKQDARSLMSALRNLSPEGRAALAVPAVNTVNTDLHANLNAGVAATRTMTADSLDAVTPTVVTTTVVPNVAQTVATASTEFSSPSVRKSNFLSTFHGGVLGLLAGTEPAYSSSPVVKPSSTPVYAAVPVVPPVLPAIAAPTVSPASATPTASAVTSRGIVLSPPSMSSFTAATDGIISRIDQSKTANDEHNLNHQLSPLSGPNITNQHNNTQTPEVVGENEFYKLRSDHTAAMRNLSHEIDRLAHISPSTKLILQSPSGNRDENVSISTPMSIVKVDNTHTPETDLYSVYQDTSATKIVSMQNNPAFDSSRILKNHSESDHGTGSSQLPIADSSSPDIESDDAAVSMNQGTAAATVAPDAAPTLPVAANIAPVEDSLIQIIGHMQAKINSMETSQTLYETSFINKFSSLEYRIEYLEQNMQANGEVLRSIQETQMQLLKRFEDRNLPVEAVAREEAKLADTNNDSHDNGITPATPPRTEHPSHLSATPHSHYSPIPPSIPNELVFTDLLARLEVVEDRLISDRASAMQSVLHKQLHHERQQELSIMLGGSGSVHSHNSTMNTGFGNSSTISANGFSMNGRNSNANSPMVTYTPQPYNGSSSVKVATPPTKTPVRNPPPTATATASAATSTTAVFSPFSTAPAVLQAGNNTTQAMIYQPASGSQYSAVHQLSAQPLGFMPNTAASYIPYPSNVSQPSPAQLWPPANLPNGNYTPTPVQGPAPVMNPPLVLPQVNPFTPKPAVYSSTEILQRPPQPLQPQMMQYNQVYEQQQQQGYHHDTQYHQQQHYQPPPQSNSEQDQEYYEDSLSQLAYAHSRSTDNNPTQPGFEPAPIQQEYHNSYHYANDDHSQLTEPNDDQGSVAEESVPRYDENVVQTPYRTDAAQERYSHTASVPAMPSSVGEIGVAGVDSTTTNQPYDSRQHDHQRNKEKYGLNDDHLHLKSETRGGHSHGHLSEETESRAIGTLQRLQDPPHTQSHSNGSHTHAARPPIRPITNDVITSGLNSKRAVGVSSKPSTATNTTRAIAPTTRTTPSYRTNASPGTSNSSDTVLLKHVADRAHASPHPVSAHKAVASAYIDAGYYQYDFDALDTPLVTLDDHSVQSNVSNDSMRYSIDQGSITNNNYGNTPGHNRLVSERDQRNNADTSMNYGMMSNINRASMSTTPAMSSDSVSLSNKDVHIQNRNVPFTNTSNTNYQPTSTKSAAANKSRSKSPHFMRPTTSHAFKAASNRPVETKVGIEYR